MAKEKRPRLPRPQFEIDFKVLEGMLRIQCTEEEIASVLGTSIDTISRKCKAHYGLTFAEVKKKHFGLGRISLRRTQFKHAETNCSMAIFLGKQYLGQSDKVEHRTQEVVPIVNIRRTDVPLALEANGTSSSNGDGGSGTNGHP